VADDSRSTSASPRRRAASDVPHALAPDTKLGRYRIGEVVRHDAFGITYRARDEQLGRDVAIKEYLPIQFAARQADLEVEARSTREAGDFVFGLDSFLAEARKLAELSGTPGLVEVDDCFEANGTACMVTAPVWGETLAVRLARQGRLRPEAVDPLLRPLLDGLERLHAAGLLHLDITPSNIVLDARDKPTLFDFGQARAALAARGQSIKVFHAPGYAAIEQFSDGQTGPFTDVHGLAATLYRCVTGSLPPPAINRLVTPLPPASQLAAGKYPPRLLAAIDAGLALRAAKRPASIAAWRKALDPDEPTEAEASPHGRTAPAVDSQVPGLATAPDGVAEAEAVPDIGDLRPESIAAAHTTHKRGRPTIAYGVIAMMVVAGSLVGGLAFSPVTFSPAAVSSSLRTERESEAQRPSEAEAQRNGNDEARRVAEERMRAEAEARRKANEDARRVAEERARAEAEAKRHAEAETKRKADEDARRVAAERAHAEAEAKRHAEAEAKRNADEDARRVAEERARTEAEATRHAEAEAKRNADEDARRVAEERTRAEAEAKRHAEAEAKRKADEDARRVAEERARTEAEATRHADAEAKRKADEDARRVAEERAHAEAEAQRQAEADARRKADEEAVRVAAERARVEAEAMRRADEEAGPVEDQPQRGSGTRRAELADRPSSDVGQRARPAASGQPEARRGVDDEARVAAQQKAQAATEARRQADVAERELKLSTRDHRRVQVALTSLGYDTRGVDEVFSPRVRQMIAAWQKAEGVPDTGFLSPSQFALLQRRATPALAKYDADEKQIDERRREATAIHGRPPASSPAASIPAAGVPASPNVPGRPPTETYSGTARVALSGGSNPNAFADYAVTLSVSGETISGVMTRYCAACGLNGGEDRRSFACTDATLSTDHSFSLRCQGAFVWGTLQAAKVHYSGVSAAVSLARSRVAGK